MPRSSDSERQAWARTRPIRVAFLVEPNENDGLMLDGIFADCHARWGGRFSLLVPCVDGRIHADYWGWLQVFDPDVVYSYVQLSNDEVLRIHETLAPSDYVHHHDGDPVDHIDVNGFRPTYHLSPLSSLSTIFRLGRHSPASSVPRIKLLDSWHTDSPSRSFTDSFGMYRWSAPGSLFFPNDARDAASILTIISEENFAKRGVPKNLDRVENEQVAIAEFAANRATGLAMLSSLYAPRLEIRDMRWSRAFNLVMGDTFEDRLLFWNARLLIPTWLDGSFCCLRLGANDLEQEGLAKIVSDLLNAKNHVTNGTGGQPSLCIRSASLDVSHLGQALGKLQSLRSWSATGPVEVVTGGHVLPSPESLRHARELAQVNDGRMRGSEWRAFRWTYPDVRPPQLNPEHLEDAPSGQVFNLGAWATDLALEHDQEKPRISSVNVWQFPRRWRMASAFRVTFENAGFASYVHLLSRPSKHGNLAVYPTADRPIDVIRVPQVDEALQQALCVDAAVFSSQVGSATTPASKVRGMWASNERAHLTGVLGMTEGLYGAAKFLLHPFLREHLFEVLGGSTNLADADTGPTLAALVKRAHGRPVFDISVESERSALATLIVKAAQTIKAPRHFVTLEDLRKRWKAYREEFHARHPNNGDFSDDNKIEWGKREETALESSLAQMRTRRMIFQGHNWVCKVCLHRNWTDFQALRAALPCDICQSEMDLPIGIPWHFMANEFLIESLRSHSVLSLVWVLTTLRERSRTSFIHTGPTCFGYTKYGESDAEADLLAVVDGKTIICEVKSAWRGLRRSDVDGIVELARRLRPDHAILAVMQSKAEGMRLNDEIVAAKNLLAAEGIALELLTLDESPLQGEPFLLE